MLAEGSSFRSEPEVIQASDSMTFSTENAQLLLNRTPLVLDALLGDLPEGLDRKNEGPGTWSPFDIMGHLIHGEHTDWIPRARNILHQTNEGRFEVFDREAQFSISYGESMSELLSAFAAKRKVNLEELVSWKLSPSDVEKTGIHPEFGRVTLKEHLSMWMAHDLVHLNQLTRVLAVQFKPAIGPFAQYVNLFG